MTTAEPARPTQSWILIATLVLVVLFGSAPPVGALQDEATVLDFEIVAGETAPVVRLTQAPSPVGSVGGAVVFDAQALGEASCELLTGFGACNDRGGRVEFAILAIEPLSAPLDLVAIEFEHDRFEGTVELGLVDLQATNALGERLSVSASTSNLRLAGRSVGHGSVAVWVVGVLAGVVAMVAIVGIVVARRRR